MGFVFVVALSPRAAWQVPAIGGVALLLTAVLSRIPVRTLGWKLLLVEPFALGVAMLSLFQDGGLRIFAAMLGKSTACLFCMVMLSSTTRFSEILRVLWKIRVPSLLVTTLALMHRYLFLLIEEAGRMVRARKSRTFRTGKMAIWSSSATVIAHLFVRSTERAEHIYSAMCSRGWKT
jgi:cobalt/nickel transport system permease protein